MKKTIILLACVFTLGAYQNPCPVYGDKNESKIEDFDKLKNRNVASPTIDNSVTLQRILTPGNDVNRFNSNQYVTLTGYVVVVKAGGPETCECHSSNPNDLDIHIELALHQTDKGPQAMIVEINRYTKASNPGFTVENLKNLVGKKVTVSGWMLFDIEHVHNAVTTNPGGTNNWRYTCWEVHPVLKITTS